MSTKQINISRVGYKADPDSDKGYVSQVFTVQVTLPEKIAAELEKGVTLPENKLPSLPKGWEDSPEKVTKKPTYEFKPRHDLNDIKVEKVE